MGKTLARWMLALLFALCCANAWAQSSSAASSITTAPRAHTLTVGVKVAPPFVIADGDNYRGLAIDLWQDAAQEHGWKYVYQRYDLEGLLSAVSSGKVDVGLGAITATAAREQRMDFGHTITSSGLGVAVRSEESSGWRAVARALTSVAFLKVIGTLTVLLLIVGFLAWLAEHKHNPEQFGGSRSEGIFPASGGRW